MNVNITDPIFHDEAKALAHMEASRWNGEPSCPHCGSLRVRRMGGKTQAGMFLCNDCRDKFTVRTGTVMERSPRSAAQVAPRVPPYGRLQEGHEREADGAHARRDLQDRLVPLPSCPRSYGRRRHRWPARRSRQGRRSRRDLRWRQGQEPRPAQARAEEGRCRAGRARRPGPLFHVANVTGAKLRGLLFTNVRRDSTLMTDMGAAVIGTYHHMSEAPLAATAASSICATTPAT